MFVKDNKTNFTFKNPYLLSVLLHCAIVIMYVVIMVPFNKKNNIIEININSDSSPYINMIKQPPIKQKIEHKLNLAKQNFNSNLEINTLEKKEKKLRKHKRELKPANEVTQQNLATGGISDDDVTAKTVLKDQSLLNYKSPNYPRRALQQRQHGKVIIRMLVNPSGEIKKIVLHKSSGHKMLDESVLSTVKYWDGKRKLSKPSWLEVEVNFVIK